MSRRLVLVAATWTVLIGAMAGSAHAQAPTRVATGGFVLTGLVYVDGEEGLAWLREPTFTDNEIVPVRAGDTVGPYRLTRILEDRVELEGPGGKLSVLLSGSGSTTVVEPITQPSRRAPAPRAVTSGLVVPMPAPAVEPPQSALAQPEAVVSEDDDGESADMPVPAEVPVAEPTQSRLIQPEAVSPGAESEPRAMPAHGRTDPRGRAVRGFGF